MNASNLLSKFGFDENRGLVWVSKPNQHLFDSERLAIEEAKRFKADAVYFRKSNIHNTSVPQVYIYEKEFSDDELLETHKNLWSSGVVPLFYVITRSEAKIFNCSKFADAKSKKQVDLPQQQPIKTFLLVGDIQREVEKEKFSAKLFDNGTFWEEHPEILKVSESPYQKLLNGLLNAKKDLESKKLPLASSTISKLLIMGVLIKYLEEKEDEHGTKLLEISRDFYQQFPGCEQFTDILRRGQILPFLEELNKKFNGKIFDLKPEEKQELATTSLEYVANVFDANIEGQQFVLWQLYAFNFLPIELISGIYEAFLKKEKGVVYTPPYLVNLLIDECMPLDKADEMFASGSFKVLDPACGSGIFLVAALKRMVQWQAILNYRATGKVDYPDIGTVKRIVKNNVFGVDIEEGATLISIFSLCIAVCDKLSPMQIWNDLRFDELGENNIRTANFFGVLGALKSEGFDLVIGNPPFNPSAGFSNKSYLKFIKKEFGVSPSVPVNDDNLALFFWDKAVELRKPDGKICFLLPCGAFLYNGNAIHYRSAFFGKYQVEKVFDFTLLSEKLFHGSATIATCAVIAGDLLEEEKPRDMFHIIVKRSKVSEERFAFEIDHYDFHKVKYSTALENPFVWKCNLWGGGRLVRLVSYLNGLRSLGEFIEERKWVFGEGYIIANGKETAEWITGKPTVDTNYFTENGLVRVYIETAEKFYRPIKKANKIFSPPHLLIKETLGKTRIPIAFSEEYLCFKHRITGIHAPENENESLKQLFTRLSENDATNRTFALAISGESGGANFPYILRQSDILNLPYPENPEDLQLGYAEKIVQNDVLSFYIKSGIASAKSPLNKPATDDDLIAFGEVFCKTLNPIYEQNGMKWFPRGFKTSEAAIVYVFCFGNPKADVLPDIFESGMEGIEKLLFNNTRRNLQISRVLREYLHLGGYDILMLIKPKALRYWLKSIALRDADETFSDLKVSGF